MSVRCKLGMHKPKRGTIDMDVKMGWGLFGGPLITYRWICARCGKRCSS